MHSKKKRKFEHDINKSIFQCTTTQEAAVTNTILTAFNVPGATIKIKSEQREAMVNIHTSPADLQIILSFGKVSVTIDAEVGEKE